MRAKAHFRGTAEKAGDSLGKIKIRNYTCGLAVTIVAFGLYSYYVRELLASLLLFSALFLAVGLIVLGAVLAWHASKQVALWSRLVSRNVMALTLVRGGRRTRHTANRKGFRTPSVSCGAAFSPNPGELGFGKAQRGTFVQHGIFRVIA